MQFENKTIWITGASSGIGEHLSYALARQGAKMVISSRKEEELNRVRQACPVPSRVHVVPLDVANFDQIGPTVERVLREVGPIDILINNAGISQRSLASETLLEVDQKIMNVNYLGTVALTKAVLPGMIQRNSGQIVVISSVLGKLGVPGRSAYAGSKHALQGFFDSLRAEVHRHSIAVTILIPGYVHTQVTVNALTADGSPNRKMAQTTANGLQPDVFAEKAILAIAKRKREAYIGKREILGIYLQRFFPAIYARIARRLNVSS